MDALVDENVLLLGHLKQLKVQILTKTRTMSVEDKGVVIKEASGRDRRSRRAELPTLAAQKYSMLKFKNFQWPTFLCLLVSAGFLLLFFVHQVDLTIADLGRHLKNGEIFLTELREYGLGKISNYPILRENYYSFSEPTFTVLNHHWLSGVIFYLIFSAVDFVGLHLFIIALEMAALILMFRVARREAGPGAALVVALLVIPLIGDRREIRPEAFSYLFVAIFFYLLWSYRHRKVSVLWLWALPVLQIFWVNSHIYFVFGPALVGLFWLQSLVEYREHWERFEILSYILGATIFACLVNPFGFQGLLEPLIIFKNYNLSVLENQPLWVLDKVHFTANPNLLLIKLVSAFWLISYIWSLVLARRKFSLVYLILGPVMVAVGWLAWRNFAIFGFLILPAIAYQSKIIHHHYESKKSGGVFSYNFMLGVAIIVAVLIVAVLQGDHLSKLQPIRGLGPMPGNSASAEFFRVQKLNGPIFNNYDIGGYLIYYLFPQEKVFVDNRPEAYANNFFEKEYVPMTHSEEAWQAMLSKYNFNVIFFSRRNSTSQEFLITRVADPGWAPVYVDRYNIIFLRRNEANRELIKKFELPKEKFGVTTQ